MVRGSALRGIGYITGLLLVAGGSVLLLRYLSVAQLQSEQSKLQSLEVARDKVIEERRVESGGMQVGLWVVERA